VQEKETGLDLIERLGIASRSVLVTSRYEDPRIRARCERLGLGILPKGLAALVPVEVLRRKSPLQGSDRKRAENAVV
jgi:hypothetical protein